METKTTTTFHLPTLEQVCGQCFIITGLQDSYLQRKADDTGRGAARRMQSLGCCTPNHIHLLDPCT
jgi:hypothetical protein